MGDRTWLEVVVHPHDITKEGWKEWLRQMGESEGERFDPEEDPNTWDAMEVNYGGYRDLENLAASGVRFMGSHGTGADYDASVFFHDAKDGTVEYTPPDTWDTYRVVVKCSDRECLDIDVKDLDEQLDLIQRYHALLKEMWS